MRDEGRFWVESFDRVICLDLPHSPPPTPQPRERSEQ